ncbi:MAG: peptidase [Sphingomonas bacterium]|uniref:M23 family metallopeptidase n=1 Tax=Sphingomonas bacterium TaxID=1895847 RepID=UPI0026144E9D|nr:M23 family metallopeptidase [Sphingomonas bacterium]MDB5695965.1 peptidase [Sphingomonas bacterium]
MTRVGWVVLGAILLVTGVFASLLSFGGSSAPIPLLRPVPKASAPAWQGGEQPVLQVPVSGVSRAQIVDSWGDQRSGGRGHKGNDIMAPGGTPVLAAAPGTVEKLFQSRLGGTALYQRSPDRRWMFYYAHLMAYAPGLREGQRVQTGDLLGFVGDTGAGSGGNHHLHFSTTRLRPEQKWYEGEDVNPFPMLRGR